MWLGSVAGLARVVIWGWVFGDSRFETRVKVKEAPDMYLPKTLPQQAVVTQANTTGPEQSRRASARERIDLEAGPGNFCTSVSGDHSQSNMAVASGSIAPWGRAVSSEAWRVSERVEKCGGRGSAKREKERLSLRNGGGGRGWCGCGHSRLESRQGQKRGGDFQASIERTQSPPVSADLPNIESEQLVTRSARG